MENPHSKYKEVTYTLKDGVNFYLGDESINVRVNVKALTNERNFFVNNNKIAHQSGLGAFKRKSCHAFRHSDHDYEVELYIESFISGRIRCTLIKDNVHFATIGFNTSTWEVEKKGITRVVKESLLGGLIGAISGYAIATLFIV